jgi:predicted nucleic acid-binding protein
MRPTRKRKASDEATVSALAMKARVPREFVQHLYDEEMAELESASIVKNFINVIASNRVRQRLVKHSSHTSQSIANHRESEGT